VSAVGWLLPFTLTGSAGASTDPVVYDAIGPALPSNVSSLSFEAETVAEFGDLVQLAPGPRILVSVSVVMSSQACQSGTGTDCTTTPGATFDQPLTIKLYNAVNPTTTPTVGSVIASITSSFAIPFRPSASPTCTGADAGKWMDSSGVCNSGIAHIVTFTFPAGTVLPDTLIWGISYNTDTAGYAPIGTPGPYDSLNVGAFTVNPTVGTDLNEDMAFTARGEPPTFASELGFTGFRPMARIDTVAETTTTTTTTLATAAGAVTHNEPLARTGSNSTTLLLIAVIALSIGVALSVIANRRRTAEADRS
jgi:hypothetical protein